MKLRKTFKGKSVRERAATLIDWMDKALKIEGRSVDDFDFERPEHVQFIIAKMDEKQIRVDRDVLAAALNIHRHQVEIAMRGMPDREAACFHRFLKKTGFATLIGGIPNMNLQHVNTLQHAGFRYHFALKVWNNRNGKNRVKKMLTLQPKVYLSNTGDNRRIVNMEDLMFIARRMFGVSDSEILGIRRHPNIVGARWLFVYLSRRYTNESYLELARRCRGSSKRHATLHDSTRKLLYALKTGKRVLIMGKSLLWSEVIDEASHRVENLGLRYTKNEVQASFRGRLTNLS